MRSDIIKKGFEHAPHRGLLRATGAILSEEDFNKPFIAIANSHIDIIPGHAHLNEAMFSDIRKAGYVINDGIHEPGVFAIAAPVFNAQGVNLGAIAVSGPSFRINESTRRELIDAIQVYSKLISKAQGFEG